MMSLLVAGGMMLAAASALGQTQFNRALTFNGGGGGTEDVDLADFNGDSDLDIALANINSMDVSVVPGGPGGSFGSPSSVGFVSGFGPVQAVAAGLFNADSDPDLAVGYFSAGASVLLGQMGATFGSPTSVGTGSFARAVEVGRFNADTNDDLVVANSGSSDLKVLLGVGNGTFGTPVSYSVGSGPVGLTVGDVNADGKDDIVSANFSSNSASVLIGDGLGGFSTSSVATGMQPTSVAIGDLNGDPDPDLAVANHQTEDLSILLANGSGGFDVVQTLDPDVVPQTVVIEDFDGDAHSDLAVAALQGGGGSGGLILMLGGGDGSFGPPIYFATTGAGRAALGDVNVDGDPDLVIAGGGADVSVLLNAQHAPAAPSVTGTNPDSPANDNSPTVEGSAPPGTTVELYTDSDCGAGPVATGTDAQFSTGIPVSVADDSVTTFYAAARNLAGVVSNCSASWVTYTEVSTPPGAALSISPTLVYNGDTVLFNASASTGLAIASYEWDLDGNGSYETATGLQTTTSRSYSAAADITAAVRVTNQLGQATVATAPIRVRLRPPSGITGVSVNNGAIATNDPNVQLSLVWPPYAETAVISNDGGFGPAVTKSFPIAARISWELQSSGPERLPKVVYVRFQGGSSPAANFTDDIILDQTNPVLSGAQLLGGGAGGAAATASARLYRIKVTARDAAAGITAVQVASSKGKPFPAKTVARSKQLDKIVKVRAPRRPRFMRVQDAATNWSPWRRIRKLK